MAVKPNGITSTNAHSRCVQQVSISALGRKANHGDDILAPMPEHLGTVAGLASWRTEEGVDVDHRLAGPADRCDVAEIEVRPDRSGALAVLVIPESSES